MCISNTMIEIEKWLLLLVRSSCRQPWGNSTSKLRCMRNLLVLQLRQRHALCNRQVTGKLCIRHANWNWKWKSGKSTIAQQKRHRARDRERERARSRALLVSAWANSHAHSRIYRIQVAQLPDARWFMQNSGNPKLKTKPKPKTNPLKCCWSISNILAWFFLLFCGPMLAAWYPTCLFTVLIPVCHGICPHNQHNIQYYGLFTKNQTGLAINFYCNSPGPNPCLRYMICCYFEKVSPRFGVHTPTNKIKKKH